MVGPAGLEFLSEPIVIKGFRVSIEIDTLTDTHTFFDSFRALYIGLSIEIIHQFLDHQTVGSMGGVGSNRLLMQPSAIVLLWLQIFPTSRLSVQ